MGKKSKIEEISIELKTVRKQHEKLQKKIRKFQDEHVAHMKKLQKESAELSAKIDRKVAKLAEVKAKEGAGKKSKHLGTSAATSKFAPMPASSKVRPNEPPLGSFSDAADMTT